MIKSIAVVLASVALLAITASAFDSQTLVGEYDGRWKLKIWEGDAELVIESVSPTGEVKGKTISWGPGASQNRWWDFREGKLEETTLKFKIGAHLEYYLTVDPKTRKITGYTTGGTGNADFTFTPREKKAGK